MPYITQESRGSLDEAIDKLLVEIDNVAPELSQLTGTLNYTITRILLSAMQKKSANPRYHFLNCLIGVLECAKMEIYRRIGGTYERACIKKNGDLDEFIKWGGEW